MPSKIVYVPHYNVVGSPTISDEYVGSNWSGSNYLTLPVTIDSTDNTWEVCINFTLTSSTGQHIFGVTNGDNAVIISAESSVIRMYLSSGSNWDIAGASGDFHYSLNTQYFVKLQFTGTNYILSVSTDEENWTVSANISSSTKIASGKTLYLGSCWDRSSMYLRGSIDLKNCYIKKNGSVVWEAVTEEVIDVSGSVSISKGYYNNGTYKIITQGTTASLTDLSTNQTVGCKNDLYMTTASGTVAPYITSLEAPTGTFDATVKLDTPVYLDWTKEYIAGGSEIAPEWSFNNGGHSGNFVTTGSLTFGADGEVSGFSSSNTLKLDRIFTATSTQSFEISFKIKTGSYTGGIQEIFAMSPPLLLRTNSNRWNLPYNTGSWNDSQQDYVSSETVYFVKILYYPTTTTVEGVTYTGKYLYFEVYDSSKTLLYRYNYSLTGTFLNFQNAESYLGSQGGTGEYWGGSIFLDENAYIKLDGELFWEPYTAIAPGITTQKALAYDSVADKTYWYPSETSVSLADVKAAQTVNMKNHLYCTNTTGSSIASLTFCEGTPSGVTEYYQQPEYVWLNSSKDTILGVQEEPDEIVIEGGLWTQPVLSSNGTWGGAAFAVSASSVLSSDSEPWKAFDGIPDTNSNDRWHSSSGHPAWIGWYNPEPLIITNIQVQNRAVDGSFINSYDVSYSDDGSTWTVCTSGTSPDQTDGAYWNIPISETTGHKYWKLISNSSSGSNNDYTAVGLITLTAYTNTVKVSNSHYWTYLQGVTYDAQGSTLAISGMSPSALTGHILVDTSGTLSYSEDTDISQSVLLPTKAYTGYDVTFTDNTYTTIQSVDKVGTKCRIYSSNIDAETGSQLFVALPVTEYEEGFEGGSLPYKSIVQSLLGLKTPLEYTTTDSFVVTTTPGGFVDYYNPTEDKFYVYEIGIYTGFRALSYSGDAYILDSTGA